MSEHRAGLLQSPDVAGCLATWGGSCVALQEVITQLAAEAEDETAAWKLIDGVMSGLDPVATLVFGHWRAGLSFPTTSEALSPFGPVRLGADARQAVEWRGVEWLGARRPEILLRYRTVLPSRWRQAHSRAVTWSLTAVPHLFRMAEAEAAEAPQVVRLARLARRARAAYRLSHASSERELVDLANERLRVAERAAAAAARRSAASLLGDPRLGLQ